VNITEDILRLLPSDPRTGDSVPAGGAFGDILVESLGRSEAGGANWCMCISSASDARVGA